MPAPFDPRGRRPLGAAAAGVPGVIAVAVAVAVACVGAAQAAAPTAVLDLPNGGLVPGVLANAAADAGGDRDTVVWESPLFARPLEFYLDEIVGMRFPGTGPLPVAAAPFRFQLQAGDLLDGTIEAIDADHITTLPRGSTAPVRIQRSVVEGISRLGSTVAGSYVGPGGLAGWRVAPDGAWRAEAGRITANRPGTAWCDVGGASRAAYEIVLSWRRRPELRIAVAAAETGDDPFWVELLRFEDGTSEAAVVRREADRAALAPLAAGDASAKRMRLVIFVDQETGLLAAVTAERGGAGVVAQVVLPPATRPASGRFRISLGSGDVCLESLRVGPWTAAEPVLDERTTASVVAKDGRAVAADIASFDKADGELVLASSAGPTRLKLDDVEEILLPRREGDDAAGDDAGPAGTAATMRAVLSTGCTVAGRLVSIDDDTLRLRVPGIDDVLALSRSDLMSLTSLGSRPAARELPGRVGTLLADGVRMKGCVVDGREWEAGIAWQPQGAVAASPLAGDAQGVVDATIEYVPRPGREPTDDGQVEIGGIGGMVNQDAGGFFVVTMLSEDGAAAQDGRLQPGDRLLAIRPRPEGGFVATKGHDVTTVMNLMRGRVGSPVVLRVAAAGGDPRDIDLRRGLIYVAGRDILEQALATHARLAAPPAIRPEDAASYPSLAILRSGDVVPCAVVGIDSKGIRLRTPIADGSGAEPVAVGGGLLQAVELDPAVPSRGIEKPRLDRLLMLPRSQRGAPPTHMIRLRDGDYLRGRLESLDDQTLVIDVRGELKKLPRSTVARVIWLHPEDTGADPAAADKRAAEPVSQARAGLLVQGVAAGRRVTLLAEGVADEAIRGTSPALGPGRIEIKAMDRLLMGRAIEDEADELPYRQWKLRTAPEPRALRESAAGE